MKNHQKYGLNGLIWIEENCDFSSQKKYLTFLWKEDPKHMNNKLIVKKNLHCKYLYVY